MKKNYITKIIVFVIIACIAVSSLSSCCCTLCNKLDNESTPGTSTDITPGASTSVSKNTPEPGQTGSEEEVKIDALYYLSGKPPSGGTSEVTIRISPNSKGELSVAFGESEARGTGDMWKSSGWMAVVLSTMLLGKKATDYEFYFGVKGKIDGPSAGCLMTAGVLAALRGQKIKEEVTMTGTINPDGTVGPVGGIPQKLEGAAKKGKKLVLVPAGERTSLDMATNKPVDLVEKGKKLGIEVKEVSNIYDAYELLTGDTLPKLGSKDSSPRLPSKAFDRFKAKAKEWYGRYKEARGIYKSFPQDYQEYFGPYVTQVDYVAKKADSALAQGMACVAYDRAFQAAAEMEAIVLGMNMVQRYAETGNFDDVIDYIESKEAVKTKFSAALDSLKAQDIVTTSDYITLFDSYSKVSIGEGLILLGDDKIAEIERKIKDKSYTQEQAIVDLFYSALYYANASLYLTASKDSLEIAKGFGSPATVDKKEIQQLGDVLSGASKANMVYFESNIIDEYAEAYRQHPNIMKQIFMQIDSRYMLAIASSAGVEVVKEEFADKEELAPMVIGESTSSYTLSAQLIAKYYSLDAELDDSFTTVVGIKNERALADMLDFADRRAVEMINLNGEEESALPIFYYENARMLRQGQAEEQITALGYYWRATILAQVQSYMSGKLGEN
ncbi:MAG TPA: hypothetical protein PL110_08815 [Candidatus Eremiobacteraeota bacterium]|nr:hypothetical protein [Candidatus Eremiobacteraeota bacterium]